MTYQMIKLRELLDREGIQWVDKSDDSDNPHRIDRTEFQVKNVEWSVIHGYGTYGGWKTAGNDSGLLELLTDAVRDGEAFGFLTADEIIGYVKKSNQISAKEKEFIFAIRAMDFLARSVVNENDFDGWLMTGVPDGDITDDTTDEDILEMYDKDDLRGFMGSFLRTMKRASGNPDYHGLYIADITADVND